MICANCDKSFKPAVKGDNKCPHCGHVMMRRRTLVQRQLSINSNKVSKFRTPSLPTFKILNEDI